MACSKRNTVVLSITGGLACGKSEVGRILGKMGFSVCDADHVAHDLMEKGSRVYQQLVEHFGNQILSADHEISRPLLGEIVFNNPAELTALNRLIHPGVRDVLERWASGKREQNANAAMLVPLLFESGMETLESDAIICVSSNEQQVLRRLEKRGLSGENARLRMNAQMALEEKEARSDYVVLNTGTLEELEQFTRETVNRIKTERGL